MITFCNFSLSDVEDPEIYAAVPILEWEKSDKGVWCMEHSTVPVSYKIINDFEQWGYKVVIYGDLTPEDHTFYKLKWGI